MLPGLFPNKKWKTPSPNIKARDVCLLNENLGKHSATAYKYCKVVQAKPDLDRLVQKAVVRYFKVPSIKAKQGEVNSRRLSLLPSVDNLHWNCSHKLYGLYGS